MAEEDRYRLAPLRDVRARDERVRRGDLAAAVGEARDTQARLDTVRTRTAVARVALTAALAARGAAGTAAQLAAADRFAARRRRELDDAIAEELRVEAGHLQRLSTVELARHQLASARAQRQVIERHFERWRETRNKLADRRED